MRRRKRQRAADADRVDAWKLADARDRLAKERRPLFDLPKRREIERHARRDDMRGIEPDRRLEEVGERPQHQARGHERNDRQRDFRDDEAALKRAAAHHGRSGAARIERLCQRVPGEEQRRDQAEHHAAAQP